MHCLLLLWAGAGMTCQPVPTTPVGRWQPADGQGTLEIYAVQGRLEGKVVAPTAPLRLDIRNPDPSLRSRPLLGAIILHGFRDAGHRTWRGGTVYDPLSGRTYRATLTLRDAQTLVVRGYVGLPLFGRTVVWSRVP